MSAGAGAGSVRGPDEPIQAAFSGQFLGNMGLVGSAIKRESRLRQRVPTVRSALPDRPSLPVKVYLQSRGGGFAEQDHELGASWIAIWIAILIDWIMEASSMHGHQFYGIVGRGFVDVADGAGGMGDIVDDGGFGVERFGHGGLPGHDQTAPGDEKGHDAHAKVG